MLKDRKQTQSQDPIQQKQLLLWPGVVIVILQWLFRYVVPIVVPGATVIGVFGGILGWLAIILWWGFFSRAPRIERLGAIILMILALIGTSFIIHESIATGGQGMMFYIYAIPVISLAFVIWAVASRDIYGRIRLITMVATILLACGVWTLFRSNGITGDFGADFTWRWTKTAEDRLLARVGDEVITIPTDTSSMMTGAQWPGFRGPKRDGKIRGIQIETDWFSKPPVELWRRPVGPGCSSFAVKGEFLFTQEQRGEEEVVACYSLNTGKPVWKHHDTARFWDSHAGAGPRSTPTLRNGRVYTLGATGILNVLNARDGALVWSRNAASDTQAKDSGWGFTGSPLVIEDVVIVATAGKLAAYDLATGDLRWLGPDGGDSYSSPHLLTIDGVAQVLLMSGNGARSFAPADGSLLWEHEWPVDSRILQPALTSDGDILISGSIKKGMRRIAITHSPDGWRTEERWTSVGMKPNFNDFVVHKGHAFGFNGPSLTCIDVKDGKRNWKGGRYTGFIMLLADQDLLLILSEKGDLALVEATPVQFTELAKFKAIENKTWNHPVLVEDILLVRNAEEMVAFRLSQVAG